MLSFGRRSLLRKHRAVRPCSALIEPLMLSIGAPGRPGQVLKSQVERRRGRKIRGPDIILRIRETGDIRQKRVCVVSNLRLQHNNLCRNPDM